MTNYLENTEDTVLIPQKSPLRMDVMLGDMFYVTISLNVTVGAPYTINELKSFAKSKLPSLVNKDFRLLPSSTPIFRS